MGDMKRRGDASSYMHQPRAHAPVPPRRTRLWLAATHAKRMRRPGFSAGNKVAKLNGTPGQGARLDFLSDTALRPVAAWAIFNRPACWRRANDVRPRRARV